MFIHLNSLLSRKTFKFDNAELPQLWKEAVKNVRPGAEKYTKYKDIRNNILYVSADDPVWIQELSGYQEDLKKHINKKRSEPIYSIKISL